MKVIIGMFILIFVGILVLIDWHKKNRSQNNMDIWNLYNTSTHSFAICSDRA